MEGSAPERLFPLQFSTCSPGRASRGGRVPVKALLATLSVTRLGAPCREGREPVKEFWNRISLDSLGRDEASEGREPVRPCPPRFTCFSSLPGAGVPSHLTPVEAQVSGLGVLNWLRKMISWKESVRAGWAPKSASNARNPIQAERGIGRNRAFRIDERWQGGQCGLRRLAAAWC